MNTSCESGLIFPFFPFFLTGERQTPTSSGLLARLSSEEEDEEEEEACISSIEAGGEEGVGGGGQTSRLCATGLQKEEMNKSQRSRAG